MNKALLTFLLLFASWVSLLGQTGKIPITNYPYSLYDARTFPYAIAKDDRGFLYTGDIYSLTEYDGSNWKMIESMPIMHMKKSEDGTIYILSPRDFGKVHTNKNGVTSYQSLLADLADSLLTQVYFYKLFIDDNDVYLLSNHHLVRYQDEQLTVFEIDSAGIGVGVFTLQDKCYVSVKFLDGKVALFRLKNDELIRDTEGVTAVTSLPYKEDTLLVGGNAGNLVKFPATTSEEKGKELLEVLNQKLATTIFTISSATYYKGTYLIGTLTEGLLIVDDNFQIKTQLTTQNSDLPSNVIYNLVLNDNGTLWAATSKGVSYIDWKSTVTFWEDKENGLELLGIDQGGNHNVYVESPHGLHYFDQETNKLAEVENLPLGKSYVVGDFIIPSDSTDKRLIVSNTFGHIYELTKENKLRLIVESKTGILLRNSIQDPLYPHRIWTPSNKGLRSLIWTNDQWKLEEVYVNLKQNLIEIVADSQGDLWLISTEGDLIHLKRKGKAEHDFEVVIHDNLLKASSLPFYDYFTFIDGQLLICGYQYNRKTNEFTLYTGLGTSYKSYLSRISNVIQNTNGDIWLEGDPRAEEYPSIIRLTKKEGGNYEVDTALFYQFPKEKIRLGVSQEDGGLWFFSADHLYLYQNKEYEISQESYHTYIREVSVELDTGWLTQEDLQDTTLAVETLWGAASSPLIVPAKHHNIRFTYTAPFLDQEITTRYQYYLEGFDQHWSEWTEQNQKEFSKLWEGTYTLRVRAKNGDGQLSQEARYTIEILAPWYRSYMAYGLYLLALSVVVLFIVHWYTLRLKRQNLRLEETIQMRTAEIQEKNEELNIQASQLQEQTEQLKELDKAKSRFFANVSHELRTPLTLITAPLYTLAEDQRLPKDMLNTLEIAQRNGKHLRELVDDILSLSKLEATGVALNESPTELGHFFRYIFSYFESLAKQLQVEYTCDIPASPVWCELDKKKVDKVVTNLLSNALKYTPSEGRVNFAVRIQEQIEIIVTDTGQGIEEKELAFIFDRFYQAKNHSQTVQGGTGIGLAIAKELSRLMNGDIRVESELGKGSRFYLQLPFKPVKTEELAAHIENQKETTRAVMLNEDQEEMGSPLMTKGELPAVLVVEDHPDMRQMIKGLLENEYDVHTAFNGEQALELLQNKKIQFHSIVSDVMMPVMDGFSLVKKLKSTDIWRGIPVIMLTAIGDSQVKIDALTLGVDDYLVKPFLPDELVARVANATKRFQNKQKLISTTPSADTMISKEETALVETANFVSEEELAWLAQVQDFILNELNNHQFLIDDLAERVHMSRSQFFRRIKKITGLSPSGYQRELMLQEAKRILENEKVNSISGLAYSLGFKTSHYFSKIYKKRFGKAPSNYL